MRLARRTAALALLVVAIVVGCGSSDSEEDAERRTERTEATGTSPVPQGVVAESCGIESSVILELRATEVDCATAREIAVQWSREPGCASPAGASRFACTIRGYRCLGTAAAPGIAVSCARPERSLSFIAKRR